MKADIWTRRLPWSIVAVALLLIGLGWMAVGRSEELRDELGGTGSRYLQQQMVFAAVALVAMLAVSLPNYRILCRHSYAIFLLALGLLVLVYLFPPINNARRWIRLGPVGIQPSEFAKIAFVLALARYLMYRDNYRRLRGLMLPLVLTVVPVLLVLREPDLGTSMIFVPVLFVMLFAAGARRGDLAKVALAGVLLLPLLWIEMSGEQKSRVIALFDQPPAAQRPSDEAFHLYQAKRMLALGNCWGSLAAGQPTDDPAAYRLPEARSDFIFCVLGERLGLPGLALALGLYTVLVWRGLAIAAATREPFGRLVAVGIVTLVAVQVLINTGMNVGLLPITGLSLPLVSYGGSGMLAYGIALGLLLNIGLRPGYEVSNEPFRWVVDGG